MPEIIIPIAILIFGVIVIALEIWGKQPGYGEQTIRLIGITLVIVVAALLVSLVTLMKISGEQTAAAFGLLGAVAGYLFGKT
jgi:hypothetical protein